MHKLVRYINHPSKRKKGNCIDKLKLKEVFLKKLYLSYIMITPRRKNYAILGNSGTKYLSIKKISEIVFY